MDRELECSLRLECLKLAHANSVANPHHEGSVVETARRFEEFVFGMVVNEEPGAKAAA